MSTSDPTALVYNRARAGDWDYVDEPSAADTWAGVDFRWGRGGLPPDWLLSATGVRYQTVTEYDGTAALAAHTGSYVSDAATQYESADAVFLGWINFGQVANIDRLLVAPGNEDTGARGNVQYSLIDPAAYGPGLHDTTVTAWIPDAAAPALTTLTIPVRPATSVNVPADPTGSTAPVLMLLATYVMTPAFVPPANSDATPDGQFVEGIDRSPTIGMRFRPPRQRSWNVGLRTIGGSFATPGSSGDTVHIRQADNSWPVVEDLT